ncbi:Endonuclease/exonuclease/phosphatase [Sistotremastrum suecicum HHB10207 ss-3]|uniref:Endonuclease/exonuclease/phosphatase n=1 Tax=Sistotremastrum suecicum HHB10207 ss-3 TaxID=1314776 RepID=A0A166J870_9AGAM|nr:Endonuclease/exonuclease/phosphatase [Sistotremastrum suecicum HHB10207 ss-3]
MPSTGKTLTPEQEALSQARKLKKLEAQSAPVKAKKSIELYKRNWVETEQSTTPSVPVLTFRLMTWNEVDRLEVLLPELHAAGYSHIYASGRNKKHGCMVLYRESQFKKIHEETIYYDEETARLDTSGTSQPIGNSFRTKNIGLIVALQSVHSNLGLVVATTHLFWHPRYTYERARQVSILLRNVYRFRNELNQPDWPSYIAGDFNLPPNDAVYTLLAGKPLSELQKQSIMKSSVVHASVDPSVSSSGAPADDEEGGEDPDRVITNARSAVPEDGLLTCLELPKIYEPFVPVRSAYEVGLRGSIQSSQSVFGKRLEGMDIRDLGYFEPMFTSYTYYWQATLDYIFIADPPNFETRVTKVLEPIATEVLEGGLPRSGICASDHVSLIADLALVPSD